MTSPVVVPFVPILSEAGRFFRELYRGLDGVLELRTFGPDGDDAAAKKLRREANRLRDFVPVKDGVVDEKRVLRFIEGVTNPSSERSSESPFEIVNRSRRGRATRRTARR